MAPWRTTVALTCMLASSGCELQSFPARPSTAEIRKTIASTTAGVRPDQDLSGLWRWDHGDARARVTVQWAFVYGCTVCGRFREHLAFLDMRYSPLIRWERFPISADARACGVCAAHRQERDMAFDDALWRSGSPELSRSQLIEIAVELGMDGTLFAKDIDECCRNFARADPKVRHRHVVYIDGVVVRLGRGVVNLDHALEALMSRPLEAD